MGLLDSMVSRAFRDEHTGRVVVFSGDRHGRGYIVRSASDELKIKSFLKMFYIAYFAILWLVLLCYKLSTFLFTEPGRVCAFPYTLAHERFFFGARRAGKTLCGLSRSPGAGRGAR
jgi:hypothetical protein